jgi:glycosyltransferase involved in cell wall biosynthesis
MRETVPHIRDLQRDDWELIILPDEPDADEWHDSRIGIIPSGRVGPAAKRDIGAQHANGDILVFLDDDSYPQNNLLDVAEQFFADPATVALGGPAMTPPDDTFWQRVSGAVFLSKLSGGAPERYVPVGCAREVDDWPSVNLMVRKADFLAIGGFNSKFWPGEDTKLCLDLIKKTSKRIFYVPELIVWHHRRAGLLAHLKQIGAYGLHRGYFARKYPETSLRLTYFVPSFFFMFSVFSLTALILPPWIKTLVAVGWGFYGIALAKAMFDVLKHETLVVACCSLYYTFLTHLVYGIRFLQGFVFTKSLVSKLR